MTYKDFNHTHFFNFEKKHKLFDKKNGELFFWDIVRFDIYYKLLFDVNVKNNKKRGNILDKVYYLKSVYFFIEFLLLKKCDYFFFTASRNRKNQTKFFDQNLGNILEKLPNNAFLFESFERDSTKWFYQNTLFNPIFIFQKIFKFFYRTYDYSNLIDIIKFEYNQCNLNNNDINILVTNFKIDYIYYSIILKLKKPKVLFVTQNGIQKGLFAAAKKYNVPVIEVQHGIIDEGHLAYNYCTDIEYKENQLILPTYFFSFSDFWTKDLFYPVKEIVSLGNTYFYDQTQEISIDENEGNGLLVASAKVFGENLKNLIVALALKKSNIPIFFKLHPSEFDREEYFNNEFKNFENVVVYTNEKSIKDLLKISKSILVIQSTALYEAFHVKKTGIIYKKQTYKRNSHVFDLPNIFLIENEDELIEALEKKFIDDLIQKDLFFKIFDSNRFDWFMNKIGIN